MPDYDNLPLNDLPECDRVCEWKAWRGCVVRETVQSAVDIASWVQLAWRDNHPPSLSPLPNPSPRPSLNYPLSQVPEPLLRRGCYETRHPSHPLDTRTPPLSKPPMIYSQS